MKTVFLHINEQQVKASLSMQQAIMLMKDAFMTISSGEAVVPLRAAIDVRQYEARALFMPVYVPGLNMIAVKIVSVYPHNSSAYQLPNIHGKLLLMDGTNGVPVCIMDAEYLTALRTGAASALATQVLANDNADVLAIFGTGVQAFTQVKGIMEVRPIKKILVYGRREKNTRNFADTLKKQFSVNAVVAHKADLTEADIICTATNASRPVLEADMVKPGCHINAIGSFKPTMQELPDQLIVKSRLYVDQRQACLSEAGDIIIPLQKKLITPRHIIGELGQVLLGHVKGRTSQKEITVFKSVGNAVQDIYAAHRIWSSLR